MQHVVLRSASSMFIEERRSRMSMEEKNSRISVDDSGLCLSNLSSISSFLTDANLIVPTPSQHATAEEKSDISQPKRPHDKLEETRRQLYKRYAKLEDCLAAHRMLRMRFLRTNGQGLSKYIDTGGPNNGVSLSFSGANAAKLAGGDFCSVIHNMSEKSRRSAIDTNKLASQLEKIKVFSQRLDMKNATTRSQIRDVQKCTRATKGRIKTERTKAARYLVNQDDIEVPVSLWINTGRRNIKPDEYHLRCYPAVKNIDSHVFVSLQRLIDVLSDRLDEYDVAKEDYTNRKLRRASTLRRFEIVRTQTQLACIDLKNELNEVTEEVKQFEDELLKLEARKVMHEKDFQNFASVLEMYEDLVEAEEKQISEIDTEMFLLGESICYYQHSTSLFEEELNRLQKLELANGATVSSCKAIALCE